MSRHTKFRPWVRQPLPPSAFLPLCCCWQEMAATARRHPLRRKHPTPAAARPSPRSGPCTLPSAADVMENALPSIVQVLTDNGSGSGFIVNDGGLVVTNQHVVEGSGNIRVRLGTGRSTYPGEVVERGPKVGSGLYSDWTAGWSSHLSPLATPTKFASVRRSSPSAFPWGRNLATTLPLPRESSQPSARTWTSCRPTHRLIPETVEAHC